MVHEFFTLDEVVSVSELLKQPAVCHVVIRAMFCGRYGDLEWQLSYSAADQNHIPSRWSSYSVQFLTFKQEKQKLRLRIKIILVSPGGSRKKQVCERREVTVLLSTM